MIKYHLIRPRWSLRTLFLIVTVVCLYLGWQARIVAERRAVRRALEAQDYQADDGYLVIGGTQYLKPTPVPWVRRMLGDRPLDDVYYLPEDAAERQRVVNAFPEELVYPWRSH